MRRLPLFPLPIVLFPGAPMPLHVFEPRYRQMVAWCLEHDRRFGLIFHDPDRHGPFAMEQGRVGCIAEILKMQPLPDGRSLILCRGETRFRVEDGIESGTAFYEALVEPFGDDEDPGEYGMEERRRRSIDLFYRVLTEAVRYEGPFPAIDTDAESGFQIAQAIRIDAAWQQELLEMRSERDRLDRLDELMRAVLSAEGDGGLDFGPSRDEPWN